MNYTPHGESDADQTRLRRLELLYDAVQGSTTREINPNKVLGGELDHNDLRLYLRALIREGLVRLDGTVAARVGLTEDGVAFVEDARRRRNDRRGRRLETQRRFLQWIGAEFSMSDDIAPVAMLSSDFAVIDGLRVGVNEVAAAVRYLADRGLVEVEATKANGHPYMIRLTAHGQECIDSYDFDVAGYVNRHSMHQVNVHGSGNAVSLATGTSSLASATAMSLDVVEVEKFVSAFREALDKLDLDDDSRATAAKELEVLADASADPSLKRKAGRTLGRIAEGAAGSGLWTGVAALALKIFGSS